MAIRLTIAWMTSSVTSLPSGGSIWLTSIWRWGISSVSCESKLLVGRKDARGKTKWQSESEFRLPDTWDEAGSNLGAVVGVTREFPIERTILQYGANYQADRGEYGWDKRPI